MSTLTTRLFACPRDLFAEEAEKFLRDKPASAVGAADGGTGDGSEVLSEGLGDDEDIALVVELHGVFT